MLRLLKTGLVDLPDTQQCALENYAYTWRLTAADWRVPFTRSAAGYAGHDTEQDKRTLADAEAARAFIMEQVADFIAKASGAPAAALTKQIFIFCRPSAQRKHWTAWPESCARRAVCPPPMKSCGSGTPSWACWTSWPGCWAMKFYPRRLR